MHTITDEEEAEFQRQQAWNAAVLIAGATVPAVTHLYSEMTEHNTVLFAMPELVTAAENALDAIENRLKTDSAWPFQVKTVLDLFVAESSGYTFAMDFVQWLDALLRDEMWRTPQLLVLNATNFKRDRDRYPSNEHFRNSRLRTFVAAFDALGCHLSVLWYASEALRSVGHTGVWSGIAQRLERLNDLTVVMDLPDFEEVFLNSLWVRQEEHTTRRWIRRIDRLVTREEVSEVLHLLYSPGLAARMYTEYVRVADFESPLTYG